LTHVIGGCFDPEFAPWSNSLLEDFRRSTYKIRLFNASAPEFSRVGTPHVHRLHASMNADIATV
jgi:hypothetical protein